MMGCPSCRAKMLCAEGGARVVCLLCGYVVLDEPSRDPLASLAIEEATRPARADDGRHSKWVPLEKHTDGLTHIRGTHDEPWHSEVS